MKKKKLTAKEVDEQFDNGESLTGFFTEKLDPETYLYTGEYMRKAKAKVIQLYPDNHTVKKGIRKKKEPPSTATMVGEIFILGLKFSIAIHKGKFILGQLCEDCEVYHQIEASYKVSMPARNHTPVDFLACMIPYLNHLVVEHMIECGIIQENQDDEEE